MLYAVLLQLTNNATISGELRIIRKFSAVDWECVWKNLHASGVPDTTKSRWCAAIHDVIPTNDRLAAIRLADSEACSKCEHPDSLLHRIIECGQGPVTWNWTRHKMGIILRMYHKFIPQEWILRPAFLHWPPQNHAAILWILVYLVHYRLQAHRRLTLRDYMDFLQRSRWKTYPQARSDPKQGRYLHVLDSTYL